METCESFKAAGKTAAIAVAYLAVGLHEVCKQIQHFQCFTLFSSLASFSSFVKLPVNQNSTLSLQQLLYKIYFQLLLSFQPSRRYRTTNVLQVADKFFYDFAGTIKINQERKSRENLQIKMSLRRN